MPESTMWIFWMPAIVALAVAFVNTSMTWRGSKRTPALREIPPANPDGLPRLSIVVPALNEEETAAEAMRTLLDLDYPSYEIIAVDDRSSDRTGEILDRLAHQSPRLRVIHVKELPAGWLGKTHAMHVASTEASGDWILFTDADVHFAPSAISRAVAYAETSRLDHLVVLPEVIAEGFWERSLLGLFWTLFAYMWSPQRVADPRRKDYIGVGAFNLVRASAYRKAGGHAAMRMEVLDDVKLGKLLKASGARAGCLKGGGMIRVRWVEGVHGAVAGLTKNTFAAMRFNPAFALGGSLLLLVFGAWPAVGLFSGPIGARALCGATIACMVWSTRCGAQVSGLRPYHALGYPFVVLIFVYIVNRSMLRTYRQRGIVWRGTHYPLSELRRGLV